MKLTVRNFLPQFFLIPNAISDQSKSHWEISLFGGDKLEGLSYYQKALKLMDAKSGQKCDWQKLLLRAFILKSLYETDQPEKAGIFKAEMEKDYGSMDWIKQFVGSTFMDT
jgi:hypothetical protein